MESGEIRAARTVLSIIRRPLSMTIPGVTVQFLGTPSTVGGNSSHELRTCVHRSHRRRRVGSSKAAAITILLSFPSQNMRKRRGK